MSDIGRLRNSKVLIVDDEPPILLACTQILNKHFQVETADSGTAALAMIQKGGIFRSRCRSSHAGYP